MAARDEQARRRSASIAADVRWAVCPNRAEATETARRASPQSLEFWRDWAAETHPEMDARGQLAAATSAHRAHMKQLSAKAARARAERKQQQGGRRVAAA
jgi:hypothetical protein